MLPKLKIAQYRNYFKFVLSGLIKPINLEVLTSQEKEEWNNIIESRNKLLNSFNENSKSLGLNVKNKSFN